MIVRFHPQAQAEFDRSTDYYLEIHPDLGEDFVLKIDQALERIVESPERWPVWPSMPENSPEIIGTLTTASAKQRTVAAAGQPPQTADCDSAFTP